LDKRKLPTPEELMELSNKSSEDFKESVLEGPILNGYIARIESAALKGYTGIRDKILSGDDFRIYKIIQDYFKENGYFCEIKQHIKTSPFGFTYSEYEIIISWENKK
jgi:hypothetical protein